MTKGDRTTYDSLRQMQTYGSRENVSFAIWVYMSLSIQQKITGPKNGSFVHCMRRAEEQRGGIGFARSHLWLQLPKVAAAVAGSLTSAR